METSIHNFVGDWLNPAWTSPPKNALFKSLVTPDGVVSITADANATTCSLQWAESRTGSICKITSHLTYVKGKLQADSTGVEVNGTAGAFHLEQATASLNKDRSTLTVTVTLKGDGIGDGDPGTFTAEARPPSKPPWLRWLRRIFHLGG